MHIPTFVFIFILFRINILLLLLYPKHVIKPLGYNLGCYMTPFFHSLSLDPPAIMEELYKRENRYSMLEDNIRVVTQTVMITNQPVEKDKPVGNKSSMSKEGQSKDRKRP